MFPGRKLLLWYYFNIWSRAVVHRILMMSARKRGKQQVAPCGGEGVCGLAT